MVATGACALPPVSILSSLVVNIGVPRAAAAGVLCPGLLRMMTFSLLRRVDASCDVVVVFFQPGVGLLVL